MGKSVSNDSETSADGTVEGAAARRNPLSVQRTLRPRRRGLLIGGAVSGIAVLLLGVGGVVVTNDNRRIEVAAPPTVSRVAEPVAEAQSTLADDALGQQVASIMNDASTNSDFGDLHASVSDATTGKKLWGKEDTSLAMPASSMKILTSAAALLGLGEDHRVVTSVQRVAGTNDIVVRGAGDPTLSESGTGFFEDAGSIADLADQISAAMPEGVGMVYTDYSLFSEDFHVAWERAGLSDGYIAPVQSVMIDAGRVDPAEEESQRSATPALDVGASLARALGAKNGGSFADVTPQPAVDEEPMASVSSAPLITRIRDLMLYSDNVLAESVARELAISRGLPPTFAGAASAVRDTLAEHGFSLDGAVLSDSSGLSTDNRISAQHLSQVLTAAAGPIGTEGTSSEAGALRPLLDCLPVASVSGTLADRFGGTEGAGLVRAKTGTLNSASALAGYVVTASGQVLTFVMISNDASILPARAAADKTASQLAAI